MDEHNNYDITIIILCAHSFTAKSLGTRLLSYMLGLTVCNEDDANSSKQGYH